MSWRLFAIKSSTGRNSDCLRASQPSRADGKHRPPQNNHHSSRLSAFFLNRRRCCYISCLKKEKSQKNTSQFYLYLLATAAHVLLEGLSLRDGLARIIVLLRVGVTGVVLSSVGVSEITEVVSGLSRLGLVEDEGNLLGGRGEGNGRSNDGNEGKDLGLFNTRRYKVSVGDFIDKTTMASAIPKQDLPIKDPRKISRHQPPQVPVLGRTS